MNLPERIAFNQFVRPAKLSIDCDMPYLLGEPVIIAGMGRLNRSEFIPLPERRLRHAVLQTLDSTYCSHELGQIIKIMPDPDSFICARANENDPRIGPGDSGISHITSSRIVFTA